MAIEKLRKTVLHSLTNRRAEWLLAGIIIARSTSYLFAKTALKQMPPFALLSIRFSVAFLLLIPFLWCRSRNIRLTMVARGALLGAVYFAEMIAETFGLRHTHASTASLLINSAIVLVPLLEGILHRKLPDRRKIIGALITFCGIAFLTSRNGKLLLQGGESLCLLAALFYAIFIILTDRMSRKEDAFTLGIFQIGFLALFSLTAAFLTDTAQLPATGSMWGIILWLAIICSDFGLTLQPMAQSHTSAERTAVFCALNPLSSALLGYFLLCEKFGILGFLGAGLILSGILISTYKRKAPINGTEEKGKVE